MYNQSIIEGSLAICNSPLKAVTLSQFCIGSLKSANSVRNINTADLYKRTENNLLADEIT